MEHLREVRAVHLLQTSADLQNRIAEIWALRETVRAAETAQRGQEGCIPRLSHRPQGLICASDYPSKGL
jgi:hypothetical protein